MTFIAAIKKIDERFPPRMFEGSVTELGDDEVGELIKGSFAKLARAEAGVQEVHEAHLPRPRNKR